MNRRDMMKVSAAGLVMPFLPVPATASYLTRRWERTGLLEGISDRSRAAVMLENQRLHNEVETDPDWKRLSIPVLRRLLSTSHIIGQHVRPAFVRPEETNSVWVLQARLDRTALLSGLEESAKYVARLAVEIGKEIDSLNAPSWFRWVRDAQFFSIGTMPDRPDRPDRLGVFMFDPLYESPAKNGHRNR